MVTRMQGSIPLNTLFVSYSFVGKSVHMARPCQVEQIRVLLKGGEGGGGGAGHRRPQLSRLLERSDRILDLGPHLARIQAKLQETMASERNGTSASDVLDPTTVCIELIVTAGSSDATDNDEKIASVSH
eukprot:TRINITY_DN60042_c0_g1_i1.p1 TRINITY_DN60042_c0_g1~~TRINITY_DN60042_c0_g1_i1.p1  ORF type:complete len:129 (+),score=13.78 TRINITY_DN60042_c0_g1_i1:151-537(+)